MIEKMKTVTVVSPIAQRKEFLVALRQAGLMHIIGLAQHSATVDSISRDIVSLTSALNAIKESAEKKHEYKQVSLRGEAFDKEHERLNELIAERKSIEEEHRSLSQEVSRIAEWGSFDPAEIAALKDAGIPLYFYTLAKKECDKLVSDENVSFIRLRDVNKQSAIAVLYQPLEKSVAATEFQLPTSSLDELQSRIAAGDRRTAEIKKALAEANTLVDSYKLRIKEMEENEMLHKVDATCIDAEDTITLLQGYVPEERIGDFKKAAAENGWAYLIDDPTDEENPPTLLKYKGLIRIIQPIYDILGTVPGYREYDISLYFLIYFSIFFAMIVGDAGYGLLFLLLAVVMNVKSKKCSDANILIYVLSATTIVWGALTGTWFGSLEVVQALPFLQKLIIPQICNYSMELFGIDSEFSQNCVMKFCFILGASQLGLACVINVVSKARKKDLSLFADIGWFIDICVLYMLTLYLVIGESISFTPVIWGVAIGFVMVVCFGNQGPGVSFVKGLTSGLGGFFTTFLNTISCFSNIMSYIRLFAVGMASLAIAQSFNDMSAMMLSGWALPAGILVIVIGHALNLVMGMLSVVVHGVRLNLLEFSGQLGMEWTGYNYDPFRKTVVDNNTN